MAIWFIRISLAYIVIGVIFGLIIGISEKLAFANVHAHINLLGWATLALAGIIYTLFPAAGNSRLAVAHFWLHNIGLPIFMVGLYIVDSGNLSGGIPATSTGAIITILGILCFAFNVWFNVKATPRSA
ncbi:MAG TPA: hypothetical protein VGN11_12245 [Candidatus Baltobacteraceae bacterium]|jgi:hypothetical protein|nr:hypothetical protein [Candidatus Baltobacteraceae bacterium]